MCTAIILSGLIKEYPLILGFNRDEVYERAFKAPIEWQMNKKKIIAPVDIPTGSTWSGINNSGLIVCVLNYLKVNRKGNRSRGHLVLELLSNCSTVEEAEELLLQEKIVDYSPCTFVLADINSAKVVVFHKKIMKYNLSAGIYVITDTDVFENIASHVKWLENYLKNTSISSSNIIKKLILCLSEHKSSHSCELTTCCHSKKSGTTSSQIISLNKFGALEKFLYCSEPPCAGKYQIYNFSQFDFESEYILRNPNLVPND